MSQVVSRHNKQILKQADQANIEPPKTCNCQKRHLPCIMGGFCKPGNVIYQASVKREDTGQSEFYTGLSEPSWKERWANHKSSLKHKKQRFDTCLSKHIWELKDHGVPYKLSFKQLARAPAYNPSNRVCRLCTKEKYYIMFHPEGATLNSRSEFFSACRHKSKLLLCPPPPKKKSRPND